MGGSDGVLGRGEFAVFRESNKNNKNQCIIYLIKAGLLQIDSILGKKTCYNFDNSFYCYLVLKVWQTKNNVGVDIICIKVFACLSF